MIDILIPTLGRAKVLQALHENIEEATTLLPHTVVYVLDTDDTDSWEAVADLEAVTIAQNGTYAQKINAAYKQTESVLVSPTADDVLFYPNWLEAAATEFDNPAVNVVGTDDLSPVTKDRTHATMPILRRSYVESQGAAFNERGTIFHEGYHHNFCETETCQLAQHRKCWAFATDSVIEHIHPAWGKRPTDATDAKGNEQGWHDDEVLFKQRRREWIAE